MGLRPGRCYRDIERAYTRKSKFNKLSFVKAVPQNKIVRFQMGNQNKKYQYIAKLVSEIGVQVRDNSIESSRQLVNRLLAEKLGTNFKFTIHVYPHHVLRENRMLTGAGADRMQQGMQLSFGIPVGIAARVFKNQTVFSVAADDPTVAKQALKLAIPRMPGRYKIEVKKTSNTVAA